MKQKKIHIFGILLIAALHFIAYSNTFNAEWHFDDTVNIRTNYSIHIKSLSLHKILEIRNPSGSLSRFLGYLSFAFNYYFHELDVTGYHVGNLLIHILAAVSVYFMATLILSLPKFKHIGDKKIFYISFFTALLWGLSPVQTNAVTYLVQRFTSIAAMFYLLSIMFYIKGRRCIFGGNKRPGHVFIAFAGFLFICSLLCKENTVVLPFVIILFEHIFIKRFTALNSKTIIYLGLAALIGFVFLALIFPTAISVFSGFDGLYKNREFTMYERLLTEFRVVVRYLSLIIYPHPARLNLDYNFPVSEGLFRPVGTFFSILFILSSIMYGAFTMRKDPLISFCIFWFFINNIIESTIVPLEIIFEHRIYLPSVGIILMIVVLLLRLIDRKAGFPETQKQ